MSAIAQVIQPEKEVHYSSIQINENGERFVLCKNCREPVFIGSHPPRFLGELCSTQCRRENAEFYE